MGVGREASAVVRVVNWMLKNIAWMVSSRYAAQGLAVLSNIVLARLLGVEGFGEYALASAVLLVGNAFTNFGMDMVLIRKLSITDVPWLQTDGLGGQLFLALLYCGAVFWAGEFIFIPFSVQLYSLALFPLSFYSIFTIVVRARSQMAMYSIAQLLMVVLQLFAVLVLWAANGDLLFFVTTLLVAHVLAALWASGHVSIRLQFLSPPRSFALLKECVSMAVIGTLRLVYEKLPVALLPALSGLTATGLFSAALRLTDAGKLGHFSAFTALYPEMTRNVNLEKQTMVLRSLFGVAFLISLFLFLFAKPVLGLLFGNEFISAVPALRILAWVIPVYVLVTYMSLGLVAMGLEQSVQNPLLTAVAVLILLLVFLTNFYGVTGSVLAVLLAEIVHAILLWTQWRRHALSKLS